MYKVSGCLVLLLHCLSSFSQQSINQESPDHLYHQAIALFEQHSYKASAILLQEYQQAAGTKSYETESEFYLALDRLKYGDEGGAEDLERFTAENKNHPLVPLAYLNIGHHHFFMKRFDKALTYYLKVSSTRLSKDLVAEYHFKRAYCYMVKGDNNQAISDFKQVIASRKAYYREAVYYTGLIYSNEGKYKEALSVLKEADGEEGPFSSEITELIANIYFQTQQYEDLISYASQRLTDKANQTNRTLNRLLGETYFTKGEYRPAARYFQRHLDLSRNKMDADGYYKLGFSYYKINNDEKAIEYFKLAALDKGALGQSSSFYLGQLYLKTKNYNYALRAFQNVTSGDSQDKMKEEAAFLIGKINFTTQQFSEAIRGLQAFQSDYPNSTWSVEASELLTRAYLSTSDYDQAIAYIESTKSKTSVIKAAYQRVCFLKAQQLFNDSKFKESINYFNKSLTYPSDPQLTMQAYYLLGEAHSLTGNEQEARQAYANCRKVNGSSQWAVLSHYGQGYLSYNQKDYAEAASHFKAFVSSSKSDHRFYTDARIRMADCHFVQKQYDQAIQGYQFLLRDPRAPQDYVSYQLALTYGLHDQPKKARDAYLAVIEYSGKSAFKDNALYQLSQSHIKEATFSKAIDYLNQIIRSYPESSLVPFAYNDRALCYFNLNQNEAALKDYRFVLDQYIAHAVANNALLGLQELSKRGMTVKNFDNYMEAFREAHPDDSSLEVVAFEAAKNKYYNQKYQEAIQGLQRFMTKYPQSSFEYDAQYFLADAYYRLGEWNKAAEAFYSLIATEHNSYKARALDKRGKSLLALKTYPEALKNYRMLLSLSANRKEVFVAQEGLMNAHFALGNMDSTLHFANLILSNNWKPAGVEEPIWLLKGKALLAKKQYGPAIDELIKVVNGPVDENSVEAKYYLAQVFYMQKSYQRSLETLFELNRNYGSYPFWIGKSFLLVADNYIAMGELLQARATIKSIIENSPEKSIVAEAKQKLKQVEKAEQEVLIEKDSVIEDSSIVDQ